jgi:diguanylate cyclase (GGDEF)-like protein
VAKQSWLIPDGADRERMLDMDRQIKPVRAACFVLMAVALLACVPWMGWTTLVPLPIIGAMYELIAPRLQRARHPEYLLFAAWSASQVMIALSVAAAGGPQLLGLAWLAIPLVTLSARFSLHGVAIGLAFTLMLVLAVGFGVDARAVIRDPPLLIVAMTMMVSVTMFQTVLTRSDVKYRAEAMLDPLTRMLNRNALSRRTAELAQQAAVRGEPIAVIVGDVDRFKRINDEHGHAVGDAALRDVADALRETLRAFDLVYRTGGEEFVVLLPGASETYATEVAQRLRQAVAERPCGGHALTMSFGVAASDANGFDYDAVFARADRALYEAKRSGRDRVCGSGSRAYPSATHAEASSALGRGRSAA